MRNTLATSLVALLALGLGCNGDQPTAPAGGLAGPGPSNSKAGPLGNCPDIRYESSKVLDNGATVTWTSSFGGFDYSTGGDYSLQVTWSVSWPPGGGGSTSFVGFAGKKKVWTPPKDVAGTWSMGSPGSGSLGLTVNMSPMHRVVEPDWRGYIGNGHFKLELDVGGVAAKLGVNVHLEDPDGGYPDRCA